MVDRTHSSMLPRIRRGMSNLGHKGSRWVSCNSGQEAAPGSSQTHQGLLHQAACKQPPRAAVGQKSGTHREGHREEQDWKRSHGKKEMENERGWAEHQCLCQGAVRERG